MINHAGILAFLVGTHFVVEVIMAIITVSRQVGSGGDEIARLVASKLNHELIDQSEMHKLAEQCDPQFKKACSLYERETFRGFMERYFSNHDAYKSLFESLHFELAAKGNVIILGRGGQMALKGVPGVFHVRTVAPTEFRVEQVMRETGMEKGEAADYVDSYGQERRRLIESLFHAKLDDMSLYDLVINTTGFSAEAAADLIIMAAQNHSAAQTAPGASEELGRKALAKKIESAIRRECACSHLRNIEVIVDTEGGATVSGVVIGNKFKDEAAAIASSFPGIKKVENNLIAVSTSM